MAYVKTNWEDYPSTATAIDADALNHMEEGIYNTDQALAGKLDNASPSFSGNMTGSGNVTVGGEVENGNGETLHGAYQSAENVLPIDTESGNPAVITDAFGGACKSLKLTLEPIQSGSGTPSQQNVRPISGRTQSIVTRTGKNLVNPSAGSFTSVASWVSLENVNANTVTDGTQIYLPEGTYTLSYAERTTAWTTQMFGADGSTILNSSQNSVTFTVSADTLGYIRINVGYQQAVSFKLQIEVGSTATDYEPYTGESITRTYGTTIYGGVDDVTGDGAVSDVEKLTQNDATRVQNLAALTNTTRLIIQLPSTCNYADRARAVSNYLPYEEDYLHDTPHFYISNENTYIAFFPGVMTGDQWRAYVASNPLEIAYPVATPTSIPLTAQNITLLHGDNVLTTDADSIEASYSADIALYIDKKIAEGISQGDRSLSKGGSSDEEVKEEEKKEEIEIKEEEPLTKEVR